MGRSNIDFVQEGKFNMSGPVLPYSNYLHGLKYRSPGENFREAMNRIATKLQDSPEHYRVFRDCILEQRFLPAGRIQASVGSTKQVTPYNCFVSGTIEDSFIEGHGCIMDRCKEAATTMRSGGGIGYDFSTLRPRGSLIKKLQSQSGGPLGFVRIFNEICLCVASSGHRRGAQMGVMRVDHPDIVEFIRAKQNTSQLTGFNLSVAVTDEFMNCVQADAPFALRFGGQEYKQISARDLWEMIMRSTWDWGEPGVLFIDTINRMNNLSYCELIAATNPCGEQPLPPYGACLLGSYNLVKYISLKGSQDMGLHGWTWSDVQFNWGQFREDIFTGIRAMDNVIDIALYPLYEQEKEAKAKRRMGIGVTGLANAIEIQGHPYGTLEFLEIEAAILRELVVASYEVSCDLAKEKGAFPLFNAKKYLASQFIQETLPDWLIQKIEKYGIRNSHLTSIAPTGTISMCADNVSSGIEPIFAYEIERTVIENLSEPRQVSLPDYAYNNWKFHGKRSKDVTVEEHLAVLSTAYKYVDSAVSKTCIVPPDYPWQDFQNVYFEAWRSGCKGCTTYQDGGKREGMMVSKDEDKNLQAGPSCEINPNSGLKSCE